jgi:hypothetical protein
LKLIVFMKSEEGKEEFSLPCQTSPKRKKTMSSTSYKARYMAKLATTLITEQEKIIRVIDGGQEGSEEHLIVKLTWYFFKRKPNEESGG